MTHKSPFDIFKHALLMIGLMKVLHSLILKMLCRKNYDLVMEMEELRYTNSKQNKEIGELLG